MQELAILSIRREPWINIDVRRQSSSDTYYLRANGAPVDVSVINWSGANPERGSQYCVGVGYNVTVLAYDFFCDEVYENSILCLG